MVAVALAAAAPREVGRMKNISKYLSDQEIQQISEAVKKAESHTSGEIVPVIVKRSSAIGHIPLVLTFILLLLTLFAEFPWMNSPALRPWLFMWPLIGIFYYILSHFIARAFWIQRILTANVDEEMQVTRRAQLEFFLNGVKGTKESTGILIFISVMERRAVILADEGIAKKIGPEVWTTQVEKLTQKLRHGEWNKAFLEAIEDCGKLLSTHFPASAHETNQLSNQLVIKE